MTRNDLLELRSRLVQVRDLTFREGEKADRSFTNILLLVPDSNRMTREKYHEMSMEGTRIRQEWTKLLDDCISVLTDEVGVEL